MQKKNFFLYLLIQISFFSVLLNTIDRFFFSKQTKMGSNASIPEVSMTEEERQREEGKQLITKRVQAEIDKKSKCDLVFFEVANFICVNHLRGNMREEVMMGLIFDASAKTSVLQRSLDAMQVANTATTTRLQKTIDDLQVDYVAAQAEHAAAQARTNVMLQLILTNFRITQPAGGEETKRPAEQETKRSEEEIKRSEEERKRSEEEMRRSKEEEAKRCKEEEDKKCEELGKLRARQVEEEKCKLAQEMKERIEAEYRRVGRKMDEMAQEIVAKNAKMKEIECALKAKDAEAKDIEGKFKAKEECEAQAIEQSLCIICCDAKRSHITRECGHLCVCDNPACQALRKCPLCRREPITLQRIYT
jgi:hypothetical protein